MEEDIRAEYTALRAEILQSDRTCLLMMGYLFTAVGLLYINKQEWLVSFLSFIALCYFTEKRFSIRLISSHIASKISHKKKNGFTWDKNVLIYRKEGKLRPLPGLRPYSVEAITCLLAALSPLLKLLNGDSSSIFNIFNINDPSQDYFCLVFAGLTVAYSCFGLIKYNKQPDLPLTGNNRPKKVNSELIMFPSMRHPSRYVWDFWYYYESESELYHVYYLNADETLVSSNQHHYVSRIGYATTYDFIRMDWKDEESFDILKPPVNHWANTSIWSGDIIKIKNGYLLFYTSRDRNQDGGKTQNIGVAFSADLASKDWQILPMQIQPQDYYLPKYLKGDLTPHAWRDPFLFRDQGYIYMMLSAKSIQDSLGRNGVVGLLRTKEENFAQVIQGQERWEYLKPLSRPGYYSEMEVPQLYKDRQGNYELVFSTWSEYDFSPTTRKAGGLQGVTISKSWDFDNCLDRSIESIESNTDFHVLMPEISGLYACRIIPELEGEVVGFDTKHGGIRRSGVKTKFKSVNRDFSELDYRIA
ncbi:MAG: hypothetical protein AAGE84_19110 [Cyanobacteria bacterium P01_G01_bin.39]